MPRRDLVSGLTYERALNIQAITTDTTTVGETIDLANHEGCAFAAVQGVITDGDYEYKLFAGDLSNMSDEVEVTTFAQGLRGTLPNFTADDDDDKLHQFGFAGDSRQFVRLKVVSTNTSTGGTMGAVSTKGFPAHAPATQTQET